MHGSGLPDYMQPERWIELAGLPYASNGKVDRQALLQLPVQRPSNHTAKAAQTPLQVELLGLWHELFAASYGHVVHR
jgi:hypothetical protein